MILELHPMREQARSSSWMERITDPGLDGSPVSFFLLLLPMRAEIERILRRSWSYYAEARRSFEAAGVWLCRDFAGSLFNLGVMNFSGLDFGGYVIMNDIGSKNKKDFLSSQKISMISDLSWRDVLKKSFLSTIFQQYIGVEIGSKFTGICDCHSLAQFGQWKMERS